MDTKNINVLVTSEYKITQYYCLIMHYVSAVGCKLVFGKLTFERRAYDYWNYAWLPPVLIYSRRNQDAIILVSCLHLFEHWRKSVQVKNVKLDFFLVNKYAVVNDNFNFSVNK